jgi:hypothetical protein
MDLAARLQHPNVVPILGSGEDEGTIYLAMAYAKDAICASCFVARDDSEGRGTS